MIFTVFKQLHETLLLYVDCMCAGMMVVVVVMSVAECEAGFDYVADLGLCIVMVFVAAKC